MRLQVANCYRVLILLINLMSHHGLNADQNKKHDFRRTRSARNSLMDDMMTKYSYPKSEVTAGVGYGHHLHPMYYRGEREMMYPCAVECDEWEAMKLDDSANDESSNVDVVTVRPDVSSIDITTPKSRPYKDVSFLRPKKYQSSLFSASQTTTTSTPKSIGNSNNYNYQDSKGADVKIIPQTSENRYLGKSDNDKEIPNDGSLYAKYYDALVSGYDGELNSENTENRENENYDPAEESIRYNPPSFNDAENDDIEAPVYPTKNKSNPKRERIEEKYVKHNVREERLEDVRTANSFGSSGPGDEDYTTDSILGKESDGYDNPSKYIDDYAAPIQTYDNRENENENYQADFNAEKPFRPSPNSQGQNFQEGERRPGIYNGRFRGRDNKLHPLHDHPRNKNPHQDVNGYSDYLQAQDYGDVIDYDEPVAYLNPATGKYNRYYGKKYPQGRFQDPRIVRRPLIYGRNGKKYPRGPLSPQSENLRHQPYRHGSYSQSLYTENSAVGHIHHPSYAPRHGYLTKIQEISLRSPVKAGGIRIVSPPRIRTHPIRHGKPPHYKNGLRNIMSPYVRGQRIHYKRTIPQEDGFTKIVKKYRSFVDHTPKRYVH